MTKELNNSRSKHKVSAGILMYRFEGENLQVLLAHPGGPFFKKKDIGAWTIPKGAPMENESLEQAALREFREEIGIKVENAGLELGHVVQRSGKVVHAWACRAPKDLPVTLPQNGESFEMEWPPRSGKEAKFPEIDKAIFFNVHEALEKIIKEQRPFIEKLTARLRSYSLET